MSIVTHYGYGLLASAFNGGVTAVVGGFGIAGSSMVDTSMRALTGHQMLDLFIGAATVHAFMWLKDNPLPPSFPSTAAPTISA